MYAMKVSNDKGLRGIGKVSKNLENFCEVLI